MCTATEFWASAGDDTEESESDFEPLNMTMTWEARTKCSNNMKNCEWPLLASCLVLADKLEDFRFYNAAVDCLTKMTDPNNGTSIYPIGLAKELYKHLYHNSPVLKLLVDFWVYCGEDQWFDGGDANPENGLTEFWIAVARGLMNKKVGEAEPWKIDRCKYHLHNEYEPKCT